MIPMSFILEPPVSLAAAGTDVALVGTAEHVVATCNCFVKHGGKDERLIFFKGHASTDYGYARYEGAGLQKNECGVKLVDVKPETSGFIHCSASSMSPDSELSDFTELIVISKSISIDSNYSYSP